MVSVRTPENKGGGNSIRRNGEKFGRGSWGWGKGSDMNGPSLERAGICSDRGEKSKFPPSPLSAQFLRVYSCQLYVKEIRGKLNNWGRVNLKYYNNEKMHVSCLPFPLCNTA